jgi:hypothetical protein
MESQYAYQRSRFTEAALNDLVQKFEGSLIQKEFALGVFLDIDGAFDNASFGSMDAASMHLKKRLVKLTRFSWSFFFNRPKTGGKLVISTIK